jgi:hypothetical protein
MFFTQAFELLITRSYLSNRHFPTASLYRDYGIFFNDFHWENFSVFKTYKSDIWYGFHLLLSLFIFKQKYLLAIQIAGAFILIRYVPRALNLEGMPAIFNP